MLGTALLLSVVVFLARGTLPFMHRLSPLEALAFSSVPGVVMVAQSPAALTVGVVALNELIAPVLYRSALIRSGEAGRREPLPAPDPGPGAKRGSEDVELTVG